MRGYIYNLLPFVPWLRGYSPGNLRFDFVAALTVAVVAIPQSMAYALIAGLPVQYGLYTAIVPCVVGSLWGSSAHLVTGPTNAISLVVFSSLSGIAEPFSDHYIRLALTLALLTGVIQLGLGFARLGVVVNFVSNSVVVGFTAGAGCLIAIKQLKNLFYEPSFIATLPRPDTIIETLWQSLVNLPNLHPATLALGLVSILVILAVKRLWPAKWGVAPGPLVAMVACGVIVALFAQGTELIETGKTRHWVAQGLFGTEGGTRVVGSLPRTLPPLSLPILTDWGLLRDLFNVALAISLLGLLEAVSIAKSIAARTHQRLDGNQEFIGQGFSNLSAAFFSAYPGSGSFTRSAVNFNAGGISPIAGVFSGLLVVAAVLMFAELAAYLPISALAGMLLLVAYSMVDRDALKLCLSATASDRAAVIVTFLATIFLHLEYAVFIGVGLSMLLYLARTSHPHVWEWAAESGTEAKSAEFQGCSQLAVVQVDGSFYFGAMNWVNGEFRRILRNHSDVSYVVLRMGAVNHIDATGISGLEALLVNLYKRGGELFLLEAKREVVQVLKNSGLLEAIGPENIINKRTPEALEHILQKMNPELCRKCTDQTFGKLCLIPMKKLLEPGPGAGTETSS